MQAQDSGQLEAALAARSNGNGRASELERQLRATCTRQAHVLEKLYTAVSALHRGATALKAENVELRAAATRAPAADGAPRHRGLEISVPLDQHAPKAARSALVGHLRDRVPPSVLADAELVVSELVTNSVCHSGASAGEAAMLRVELTRTTVLLEVADSGRDGLIAPRHSDVEAGHGFGLGLVQTLSRRWGVERVANTGTRVWAELPYESPLAAMPA